jgi:hypothetical protein
MCICPAPPCTLLCAGGVCGMGATVKRTALNHQWNQHRTGNPDLIATLNRADYPLYWKRLRDGTFRPKFGKIGKIDESQLIL